MPGDSDPARREPTASPIEEARRLFAAAEDPDSRRDRGRHADRLKGFLAYVEGHRDGLSRDSPEVAKCLDETGVAFYQMNQPDLALRAVEVGLAFSPSGSALLHHKAVVLLYRTATSTASSRCSTGRSRRTRTTSRFGRPRATR